MKMMVTAAAMVLALLATPVLAGSRDEGRAFAAVSEPGRRALMQAMAPTAADTADRERVKASRDRMLKLVAADRLDVAAVRRVMDEERAASNAIRARRQAALLQSLAGLSVADRKAFAADAGAMRGRFEKRFPRLEKLRERRGGGTDEMSEMMPPL